MKMPITKRGEELLRKELADLLSQRPVIAKLIGESRELGDLKENGEYHANREKQGMLEARIEDIENKLGLMELIDVNNLSKNGKIVFGVYVGLKDLKNKNKLRYQIVGDDEARVSENKISIFSPLARTLIGKTEGDTVSVGADGQKYEVISVEYSE